MSPDHEKRDSTDCPTPQFTALNGLEFKTYCGHDLYTPESIAGSLGMTTEKSMTDCMNTCASSTLGDCFGVWFNTTDSACWQLDRSGYNYTRVDSDEIDLGLSHYSQWRPPKDLSCPFKDGSQYTTKNGEEFEVVCNKDFGGYGDMCAYSLGPYMCHPHADTLAECMEYCSQAHPLCTGVSWNPNMNDGYDNCYLKSQPYAGVPDSPVAPVVAHSARAAQGYPAALTACPNNTTYTSEDGGFFKVDCFNSRILAANYSSSHQPSVGECMDRCSADSSQRCAGVLFNFDLSDGFDNCYLLNNSGQANSTSSIYTFAELTSRSSTVTTPSGSSSSSRAWIAGPVVGGLVVIALLAGLFFWLGRRSRKRRPQDQDIDLKQIPEHDVRATETMYEAGGQEQHHMLPTDREVHELRDPKTEALIQHEMET